MVALVRVGVVQLTIFMNKDANMPWSNNTSGETATSERVQEHIGLQT